MAEASPVKFYIAKFAFLVIAMVQWLIASVLVIRFGLTNEIFFASLFFFLLGVAFFYFFLVVNEKVKRVAIGKNKIVIIEGDKNSRFSWPEIKSLKIIPFLNLYRLKLRGRRKPVYFFQAKNVDPAFDRIARNDLKVDATGR